MAMTASLDPNRLTTGQIARLAPAAVALWFAAAMAIRAGAPLGCFDGVLHIVTLLASVPLAWGLVWLVQRVASLRAAQLIAGTALACGVALLCDAVALSFAPELYGADRAATLPGAAWLMWGVAWSVAWAWAAPPAAAR